MSSENGAWRNGSTVEIPTTGSRAIFTGEADHRIANSFSLLAGTISNRARQISRQQRMLSSDEVSDLLREVGSQVAAVGQFHRQLATQPEGTQLDLNEHLWTLCDDLIDALAADRFTLIRSSGHACAVLADKVLPICLIVAEIVTNALKYAHPSGVPGTLMVGCREDAEGSVLVEVTDDGVGLPEGWDPAADGGLGSRTVDALAKKLNAHVAFVSRPTGLSFRLRVPAATA